MSIPKDTVIPKADGEKLERDTVIPKADGEKLERDRKLQLVLDLDQTLLHSHVSTEPIPSTQLPDHVATFHIPPSPLIYHMKLRPHVQHFLSVASEMFQLSVCTRARRSYAEICVQKLDPTGSLFGNRIITHDERRTVLKSTQWDFLIPERTLIVDDDQEIWLQPAAVFPMSPYTFWR